MLVVMDMQLEKIESEEHKMDNAQAKEQIKQYWEKGDITGILQVGFESFLATVFDRPLTFGKFLDYTGDFFDRFILETSAQEQLKFIAGKLHLELTAPTQICLNADLYFQDHSQQWVLKQKTGGIDSSRFKDWETSADLKLLRERKKLELPIDSPKEMR